MIERLKAKKSLIDVYEIIKNDKFFDFYITENNERKFLNNRKIIKKVLDKEEMYGLYDNSLKGILMINREKGYRTYIKIMGDNEHTIGQLFNFLSMNFQNEDIFLKIKQNNHIVNISKRFGFGLIAYRGKEVLLLRNKLI
jgi:hypothetical protein